MGHSRFLWALRAEAAFGAGSAHALTGHRAAVLGKASPPACPLRWAGCSFPVWWLRRNREGKDNPLLRPLMMLPLGHRLGGSLSALAGHMAVPKDTCGPQEQWGYTLPACLPAQSPSGHGQTGQQVAGGLADPTPAPGINHSNKS